MAIAILLRIVGVDGACGSSPNYKWVNAQESVTQNAKKHRIGVICVEKGRSQKFVDYSQEMGWEILDMFGFMVK